jgi:hypothetical protein
VAKTVWFFPATCCPRVKMIYATWIEEDTISTISTAENTTDPCSFFPWLSLFMDEYDIRGTEVDNTVVRESKKNISEAEF